MTLQSEVVKDIVGAFGLPGALAALAVAFYYGVRAKQALSNGKSESSDSVGGLSYRDAVGMSRDALGLADKGKEVVMANIDKTRHDINGNLAKVHGELLEAVHDQTEKLVRELEQIAVLISAGIDRRLRPRDG